MADISSSYMLTDLESNMYLLYLQIMNYIIKNKCLNP